MKPIIISAERIKTELTWLVSIFAFVNIVNIYSIIEYDTSWWELLTVIPFMLIITLILYPVLRLLGCAISGILKGFRKQKA
jgi:hypothetical protein